MKLVTTLLDSLKAIGLILLALSTASCGLFGGDERPVYQGAEYYKNLEIPPDLTAPDTRDQLVVPKPTSEALQRFRDNNKLETVITPKFDGVRVVNYAGNSWLEVDNDVERVWQRLQEFWQNEGIELAQVRPSLGFMETQWVERLGDDVGLLRSMFQKFEPDVKDKFRIRVERFDFDQKTRIYVAHSRIERILYGEEEADFVWQSQPADLEAEREIISRMALFTGKSADDTVQLLQNYRPYSSLVKIDSTNATTLTMTGSMGFVWRRAMRALDRMRVEDIREHKESSSIDFVVGKASNERLKADEDDLSKTSWIMRLFTDVDEENLAANKSRHYRLEFSEVSGRIQIDVKDAENTQLTDEDGAITGTALAEQLRDRLAENLE
ncbi:outer membrane protein assembly factor BamC [Cardiobacterium sp. AH-315-I02]|nr:outer membrane protein assembly factor BamC [Cardiobacterium sp. AH-315-I02]